MIALQIIGAVIIFAIISIAAYIGFWKWYNNKYPNPLLDATEEYLYQSRLEAAQILRNLDRKIKTGDFSFDEPTSEMNVYVKSGRKWKPLNRLQ